MALESTLLTSDLLHTLFEERDGELYRKVTRGGSKAGSRAGHIGNRGYRIVVVNGRQYMEHRLIWIMHGNDPVEMLDHIDGDQLNNKIENLRAATNSQNQRNQKLRKDSTSGIKGVSWISAYKRWAGQVWHKGKLYRAGYFKDKDECAAAVRELRESLHGEFARH
jgi:hypothetical protein